MRYRWLAVAGALLAALLLLLRGHLLSDQRVAFAALGLLKESVGGQICAQAQPDFPSYLASLSFQPDTAGVCQLETVWQVTSCAPAAPGAQSPEIVDTCPRPQIVAALDGKRAWDRGDEDLATRYWSRLPAPVLLDWGMAVLTTQGYGPMAHHLLTLAAQGEDTFSVEERFDLSMALGDYYRQADMWAEAIPYYEAAWTLFPKRPRLAEYLGRSYNRVGRFQESAAVLEQGLADLPAGAERPILVANYLIDLGTSQEALGDHESACSAFQGAHSAIETGAALITAQQSTQILARIALLSDDAGCSDFGLSP